MNYDTIKYDAGDVRNKSLMNNRSLIKQLVYWFDVHMYHQISPQVHDPSIPILFNFEYFQ